MRKTIYIFVQRNPLGKKFIFFSRFKCVIFIKKIVIPFKRFIYNLVIYVKKKIIILRFAYVLYAP